MTRGLRSIGKVAAPIIGGALGSVIPGVGTAIGAGLGGAIGGASGGGGLKGALLGGGLGYLGGGGLGQIAGAPVSATVAGPTQGSGLLGALTRGGGALASGVSSAAQGLGALTSPFMSAGASGGGGILGSIGGLGSLISPAVGLYSGMQQQNTLQRMQRDQQAGNQQAMQSVADFQRERTSGINTAVQTMQPFAASGVAAQNKLGSLLGLNGQGDEEVLSTLRNSPGYQFRLNQGQDALNRSAAARGGLLSGRALQESQALGQGLADQTYNDYVHSLQRQTAMGQSAAGGISNLESQRGNLGAAGMMASLQTGSGDINAAARAARRDAQDRMLAGLLS